MTREMAVASRLLEVKAAQQELSGSARLSTSKATKLQVRTATTTSTALYSVLPSKRASQYPSARRKVPFATDQDELRVVPLRRYQEPPGADW